MFDNNIDISDYLNLVYSRARKLSNNVINQEDLAQEGMVGLCLAKKKFDPGHSGSFSSFAIHYINGCMIDYIRKNKYIVPIGSNHHIRKANNHLHKYRSSTFLSKREAELAANELNVPMTAILEVDQYSLAMSQMIRLDYEIANDNDSKMSNHDLVSISKKVPEYNITALKIKLNDAIDTLSPDYARMMRECYLNEPKTSLSSIARELKITPQAAAARAQTCLKQLRRVLKLDQLKML